MVTLQKAKGPCPRMSARGHLGTLRSKNCAFKQVTCVPICLSGILSVVNTLIIPLKLSHTLPHFGLSGPPSVQARTGAVRPDEL